MRPLTFFPNILSESSPQLVLVSERCLRSRLNTNQCQRCLESCPCGALSERARKIDIDATQCTGCMSCVAACPQDALVCDHDLDKMLSSCQTGRDVLVSCLHQAQNHPDEMTIPCVGILSKQVLTAIALSGCRSVTFNLAGCAECANREISRAFTVDCQLITEFFSSMNPARLNTVQKKEHLPRHRMDRRTYLRKSLNIVADVSRKGFSLKRSTPVKEAQNSRRIPLKTQLVKKVFTGADENSQKKILDLFGYTLSTNQHCNCCPLCKGMCPTGAIKIDSSGQEKRLKFEMLDCSGCGLCVEFCKKDALLLEPYSMS